MTSSHILPLAVLPGDPDESSLAGRDSWAELLALPERMAEIENDEGFVGTILQALLELVGAERAFLIEFADDGETWEVIATRSFEGEPILHPQEKIIEPLLVSSLERGEGYLTLNLEDEEIHAQLRRSRQPRTRSLLVLPLRGERGVLYLDHRFRSLELSEPALQRFGWLYSWLSAHEGARKNALRETELVGELREIRKEARSRPGSWKQGHSGQDGKVARGSAESEIIGQNSQMLEVLQLVEKVAPTAAPILINGDSGTGKELIAMEIHRRSPRAAQPFVSENCGALTETLLESELFGYVKGAFTGAYEDRAGLFELAHGGTLFLDEVGDTSPAMQKKLLRALQEGIIRRVGGSEPIQVDVRVVSATNKDLLEEVRAGRFREDLFYRLNVINIVLPPLRERLEDIPLLAEHFVRQLNERSEEEKALTAEFLVALSHYSWPGNIRELQNEIRRAYALSDRTLSPQHLSERVTRSSGSADGAPSLDIGSVLETGSLRETVESVEKEILAAALARLGGNKALVCARLEIPKTTLYAKLKRYGLS